MLLRAGRRSANGLLLPGRGHHDLRVTARLRCQRLKLLRDLTEFGQSFASGRRGRVRRDGELVLTPCLVPTPFGAHDKRHVLVRLVRTQACRA